MAHVQKYPKSAIGHMCNHYGRSEDMEKASYIIRGNENIDASKTHLNYNLAEKEQSLSQIDFIHKRLSEVKVQNRKDVNVLCDWVITAPKDLPQEEHRKFFEESYKFLNSRYGKENVVSAYVHMDETTPHMHYAFIPVKHGFKENKKNPDISTEYYKVSAKEVLTRYELKKFHPDLQRHLEMALGHEVRILNDATKEGNRSIQELKRQSATERLQEVTKEASEIVSKAQMKAFDINNSLNGIKAEYEAKKAYVDEVDKASKVSMMYPEDAKVTEKGIIHKQKYVTVPAEIWEAKHVSANEKNYLKSATESFEKQVDEYKKTLAAQSISSMNERITALEKQNHSLKKECQEYHAFKDKINRVLHKLPENVTNAFLKEYRRGEQHRNVHDRER